MTPQEMYKEFDLFYNNLMSNQAPGLTPYEIAVYLTKAQSMITDELYEQYENSERVRKNLAELVVSSKLYPQNVSYIGIDSNSKFFLLPDDLRFVVYESLGMSSSADSCVRNSEIHIQPVMHDEYTSIHNNPYRFNIRRALRLDVSIDGSKYAEIVSKDSRVNYYMIRYIKNPTPIFMEGCSATDSIDGVYYTGATSGEMNPILHRTIVEAAAKLAYQDYKV